MQEMSDKKNEIMRVATNLLLNNSYAKVNMSTIAEACGITKAGIYYHFINKEALIKDCLASILRGVNDIVFTYASEEIPVRDKLKKISNDLYAIGKKNPGVLTLFMRSISEPELRVMLKEMDNELMAFLREVGETIRYGFASGEVRTDVNPFLAARMLAGTFMVQIQTALIVDRPDEFDSSDVVDMIFDGIGAGRGV